MKLKEQIKNRGALSNPEGRFESIIHEFEHDGWDITEVPKAKIETTFYPEPAKSIISKNDSPDIGFEQSINPYRGCEHGCIYCYARPSHSYVNLSGGIDFETKIFYKLNAADLLENAFRKSSYQCKVIVVGANTDPYQPAESKFKITRSLLEVFLRYKHPVSIITKNALILRDLDLLAELNKHNLLNVAISVTSLSTDLKRILEPRTSTPEARIRTLEKLTQHGIPVRAMLAPMIPMINDMELENILQKIVDAGVKHASYVLIRLPHEVKTLFKEWLNEYFPDRAGHVMSLIKQMRGGKEYDSTFGTRMKGEGEFAQLLSTRFKVACKRLGLNQEGIKPLNTTLFTKHKDSKQYSLDIFE